jgi:hypothetical protein
MLSHEVLASQIEALSRELARAIGDECQKCMTGMQAQIETLTGELEAARSLEQAAQEGRQGLAHDLEKARKRITTLMHSLKEARQEAAEARKGAKAHEALRQQVATLQDEITAAQGELDQERSIRKRLEKGAAADERRLRELESALAAAPDGEAQTVAASDLDREIIALQKALQESLDSLQAERAARQGVEQALDQADRMITALEEALKGSRKGSAATGTELSAEEQRRFEVLATKLADMEVLLQREQAESRKTAAAYDQAMARIFELEDELRQEDKEDEGEWPSPRIPDQPRAATKPAREHPLPHQLRPAPKTGARFHPDWDLCGLPCRSADQVAQAWGSVANVQLSLEGYPSQYCAAFLVVLKQGKQKRLYLLFNLKSSRHILVCVPAKTPGDEAALNRQISDGHKYLRVSGFELEEITAQEIPATLGRYFLKE